MQKITCTLEFKDGRPVAKEVNLLARPNEINYSGFETDDYFRDLNNFLKAENSRREFEISEDWCRIYKNGEITIGWIELADGIMHCKATIGMKFTATIQNNIVTKIELI